MSVNCHVPNGDGYIYVVPAVLCDLIFVAVGLFLGDLFLLPGCGFFVLFAPVWPFRCALWASSKRAREEQVTPGPADVSLFPRIFPFVHCLCVAIVCVGV